MNFFLEWALAVHRAVWFPLNWAFGLESPPMQAPIDIGVALANAPMTISRGVRKRRVRSPNANRAA